MPDRSKSEAPHQTSRRCFLRDFVSTSIALPLLPELVSLRNEAVAAEGNAAQIHVSNPSFSRTERDRRWEAIRRVMVKPQWNLDAILAPASGDQAYPRYLTQIGGRGGSADVVFSRDSAKPVHAMVPTARNRSYWEARLEPWCSDGKLTITQGEGAKSIAAQLKNLGLASAGIR